jgi:acetyltransferase
MSIRNLDKIFNPSRVAVVGASDESASVGYTVFRNLIGSGFAGVVYPVNSKRESVQGIQAYKNIASLPHAPDLAIICTPAPSVPELVRLLGEAGTRGIIIISAGFREVGESGRQLEELIRVEQRKFPGMRILGPNCLGIMVPSIHLNASFAADTPAPGHIGFISQSGALCTSVLDWAIDAGIGFSYFVSVGNMLDVSMADLIDYFGSATDTQSIILYIESITEAREFVSAARAFSRTKPIVAFKAGRFAESAKAAASHTGAMAGVDAVYEAVFQRAGIERIFHIEDMFNCAEILAHSRPSKGDRLAILTNAGGPGVMSTDQLIEREGNLAVLSEETIAKLNECLPSCWSHGNPVDVLGDAPPDRYAKALEIVLEDKGVDAVLVILTPQAMTDSTGTAEAVSAAAAKSHKPVIAAWMGGHSVAQGMQVFSQAGLPAYQTPEKAIGAFMHLVSYARNLEILYETPREIQLSFSLDRRCVRSLFDTILIEGGDVLSENISKSLLESYEIPVTRPKPARSAQEAIEIARGMGYPVVMKIHSPQITHKTDVGGVKLDLASDQAVAESFTAMVERAKHSKPNATIIGVTIQKMIAVPNAYELIMGMKKDPVFGAVLLVGMGGVSAEVFKDRALALPPLNETLARRALESLKSWPLLKGYRGKPAANIDRLIEILMRFSYLVADYPEISELDVNPLLVTPDEVIALDARVVIDHSATVHSMRRFGHLAIRPYPEEYVTQRTCKDGTAVTLRPIKPEDEPMWHELLGGCSKESIRFRFSSLIKKSTHEMASRYCFIDYDREIAIVAEVEEEGSRKLIAVGRLAADANHDEAEYAVLIADRWQCRGLGGLMTDFCVEVARRWGVKRLVAEVSKDNHRMLSTFKSHGFSINDQQEEDVALVRKEL